VHRPRFLAPPSAGASPEAVMLRLTATVEPGQAGDLASTVLARAARPGAGASTIVLVLDGTVDSDCLEALALLQDRLRALGTCLRLVIGPRGSGQPREPAASTSVTSLAIHPSLRSAVLAVFAARLGPGLVTAQVRAALSAPAEPLHVRAGASRAERHARPEAVRGAG